jgi:hypothetical protein
VKKYREEFDFIDDFARSSTSQIGVDATDSKLLPVLYGEKVPAGG